MKSKINKTIYKKIFSGIKLNFDERKSLVSDLISDKIFEIIFNEIALIITNYKSKVSSILVNLDFSFLKSFQDSEQKKVKFRI